MEIEKYVLEEVLKDIIKTDSDGKKYILEIDLDNVRLNNNERNFVFQTMINNNIELVKNLIEAKDRPSTVKDFEFGDKKANVLESIDIPSKARIEYNEDGQLIFEDYSQLKEFLKYQFIPNNVVMSKKKKMDDYDEDKQIFPTIQFSKIVKLKLSEKEIDFVMNYLNECGITVRGRDSSIDQGYENYDYYVTYKNQMFPEPLTKEETQKKFELYTVTKDPVIREQLIIGNLKLVPFISWIYSIIYNKDISEIESYGYEGLIEAVDRFNPSLGFSFSTFAFSYIEGYIKSGRANLDNLSRNIWSETFYKCRQIVEQVNGESLEENIGLATDVVELMIKMSRVALTNNPNVAVAIRLSDNPEIAVEQKEENIRKIKLMYLLSINDDDVSYDLDTNDKFSVNTDIITDQISLKNSVKKILSSLSENEQKILSLYFGLDDGVSRDFDEISKLINCPEPQVGFIFRRSIQKLRNPSNFKIVSNYLDGESDYFQQREKNNDLIRQKLGLDSTNDANYATDDDIELFKRLHGDWYDKFCEEWDSTTGKLRKN